jgi:hypothetical protein
MLSFHDFERECRRLIQCSVHCAEWSLEFGTDGTDWIVRATTGAFSVFERICVASVTPLTARELFPSLGRKLSQTSKGLLQETCNAIHADFARITI